MAGAVVVSAVSGKQIAEAIHIDPEIDGLGIFPVTADLRSPGFDETRGRDYGLTMEITSKRHPITGDGPNSYSAWAYRYRAMREHLGKAH